MTEDNRYASELLPGRLFGSKNRPDVPTYQNGVVTMICRYEVNLDNGKLLSYRRLQEGENAFNVWYAYRVVTEPLSWFNNQPYVDTLNPEAIQKFIAVTHEPYYQAVGQYFAKMVPTIFTDEPSFHKQEFMVDGAVGEDVGIAYTDNLEMHFCSRYGYSLLDHLPEVFWERADGALSQIRYHYYDCVAWLFSEAYGKTLGDWCDAHNLLLTGHLLFEDKLQSQSEVVGDVMRTLRYFTWPVKELTFERLYRGGGGNSATFLSKWQIWKQVTVNRFFVLFGDSIQRIICWRKVSSARFVPTTTLRM